LAESQAFVDGNKRAALDVALTFLAINGFDIGDEQMELYDAMIAIADKTLSKEQLADLFERHHLIYTVKLNHSKQYTYECPHAFGLSVYLSFDSVLFSVSN
jgi:prophage maintenance system killer protein